MFYSVDYWCQYYDKTFFHFSLMERQYLLECLCLENTHCLVQSLWVRLGAYHIVKHLSYARPVGNVTKLFTAVSYDFS